MATRSPRVRLSITISGGDGEATIPISGDVVRTIFDGPDAATYDWLAEDEQEKPINGRTDQVGDRIISEEYPVREGGLFKIIDSDIDGAMEVTLWLKA